VISNKKYVSQFALMGTIISITLFENRPQVVFAIFRYLQRVEHQFSANNQQSELMQINQNAGHQPVMVSATVFNLIKYAVRFSRQHSNSFNIAVGPLVKLWHVGFADQHVPKDIEIKKRLQLVDINAIKLNETKKTIYLEYPGMELDLGAIAKGYFADQIGELLRDFKIKDAIIDLGGNVVTFGINRLVDNKLWQIGIQDPQQSRGVILGRVQSSACSAVTSGIGERNFNINGRFYHHIISPQTGYPLENDVTQVTIFSKSSLQGELLSTIAFFAGSVEGLQLIEAKKDAAAVFVTRTGEIKTTNNLDFEAIV
jgi:thiamine biosynthesis lipoprotein